MALPTLLLLLLLLALAPLPAAASVDNPIPTASRSSPLTVCAPLWDDRGGRLPSGMSDADYDDLDNEGVDVSVGSYESESSHVARG